MKNLKKIKSSNTRCETEPSFTQKKPNSFSIKEANLFSYKTSLEILLNIIKKSQISFLSKLSENNKPKTKELKEILTELKEHLNSMYKEQMTKATYYETQLSNQKSIIQNQLYENKQKNKNFQKIKGEIEQLTSLNFLAENEIKLIENLIKKNICIERFLNKNVLTQEEEKEINCLQPKFYNIITHILHKENIETKKQFKFVVSAKQFQDEEIKRTIRSLEQLKYYILDKKNGYNNYIYDEDIIPEESKEFTQSMTINNINKTINKIIMNKNNINEDSESENSSINSNKHNINNDNKKEDNRMNNYINLNMNINLNFNFDKIYNITDDIKYNTDREIKTDKKKEVFKREKGFASTGNLPYLIIQSIKEDTDTSGKKIEKKDVYKCTNKLDISHNIVNEEYFPTI